MDIIVKETEPTSWINSMVVVMRKEKMRLCLDPKDLNNALSRPHYQMPTIDDILPNLAKAKIFSVLDAKDGFWQIKLDEESSKLTTFWTPEGRYRWKRLAFGLAPAPKEFQRRLHEIVYDLDGIAVIADDVLVYGRGDSTEAAIADHDEKLRKLLQRARKNNLKFNQKKMKLRQKEVSYMGHVLTEKGLKPDSLKIEAIVGMPHPKNVKDVQRILGLINYLSKFIPSLATISEPLRQLTRSAVPWTWDETHKQTFEQLKKEITKTPTLKYYEVTKPVTTYRYSS